MMSGLTSDTSLLTNGLDEGHSILGGNVRQKRSSCCHGAYAALAISRNRHSWPLAEGFQHIHLDLQQVIHQGQDVAAAWHMKRRA